MKTTASKMGILVRKTIVLALMLVVGAHMAPENIQSAGAQDAEASEGPYSDRSPENTYSESAEGKLQVGLGEADITPTWKVQLPYGAESKTDKFYDETKVKALVLEAEGKNFAILEYDAIGIGKEETSSIKKRVSGNNEIEKENIIIGATHNHSYPRVSRERVKNYVSKKSVRAVETAIENKFSGKIGVGKKKVREDISLNRAILNGKSNTRLHVMKIEDEDGNLRGVHYNFGVHPTIFTEWGDTQGIIGPEWPGYVNQYVKMRKKLDLKFEKYQDKGDHSVDPWVMFSQGAAGDQEPRRSDVTILGEKAHGSKVFAEKLAQEVLSLLENVETTSTVKMQMRSKTLDLRRKDGTTHRTLLQSLAINNSLISTIPGELNFGLARDFIRDSPYENNILVTVSGDYIGYIVQDHLAWEEVTYQAKSVAFEANYGERIVDESLKLADPSHRVSPKRNPGPFMGSLSGTVDYEGNHTVAVGVKRMPSGPNYAGGFWGRRTVINSDGSWQIDSLSPGQFYIYVVETDRENPRPSGFKSSFEDIRDLIVGYPVEISRGEDRSNVNFRIPENYLGNGIESIEMNDSSITADGYSLRGSLSIEGDPDEHAEVSVGVYPAQLSYRSLVSYVRDPILETTADSSGEFSFDGLTPGRYRLVAFSDLNSNGLKEPVDLHTNPRSSPVVVIGSPAGNQSIDNPRRGASRVILK
jgi:hypothetical protein